LLFISCLLIYMLNYLLFLSMVHEYAYFVMNIFGKRSIKLPHNPCRQYGGWN